MTHHGRRWRSLAVLSTLLWALGLWQQWRLMKAGREAVEIAAVSQAVARACIIQMEDVYQDPDPLVFFPRDAPQLKGAD